MNLFAMMETSGGAMQAERMRAEVVAANMANAETTRTAAGGVYHRQHVVFAANAGDSGFADSMNAASGAVAAGTAGTLGTGTLVSGTLSPLTLNGTGRRRRGCMSRRWSKIPRRLSSAMTPGIRMRERTDMSRIRTLIPSQRWWT